MAKAKVKFDPQDFLLKKGEFLAMGLAGFCLVVLLLWGVSKWSSAKDPNDIANDLNQKSANLTRQLQDAAPDPTDLDAIKPADFIVKPQINKPAKVSDFPIQGPIFDPTAQPNTKRENPVVFNVDDYQVDLTRSAMPGYDIIYDADNEPLIAVLTSKAKTELDKAKLDSAIKNLKDLAKRGQSVNKQFGKQPPPMGPMGPGGPGGGPGPMAPPGLMGGGSPYGTMGGAYDASARRADEGRVLTYVPLKEIDKALAENKPPALTVIPVRLVTIHAVVPYKKQLDELKRALRLPVPVPVLDAKGQVLNQAEIAAAETEARRWGPVYDGFEVQRRETRVLPNGQVQVIQDWAELPKDVKSTEGNYKFEEKFISKIDTRAIGYQYDEGFLPYFLKPEMMLSMPLPLLAPDLKVKYPEIRLKAIQDNIKKLEDASKPKLTPSETYTKVTGSKPKNQLYGGRATTTGSFGYGNEFGGVQAGPGPVAPPGPMGLPGPGPMGTPGPVGGPRLPDGFGQVAATPVEIENYLLRFVDCDVEPGRTYEYRLRLRMLNPNFGLDKYVANPEFAKETYRVLYSKWVQLKESITVPAESFLYAFDTKTYREQTEAAYAGNKDLLKRLQLQDNQAVVQMATWTEQVKTDTGGKREPVGAWVVAEVPVGRGEYVGRKQYVKLPLWSSESQPPQYVLREVPEKIVPPKGKEAPQPKGWLVDFSTRSILVDFEGGKVKSKFNVGFDDKGNVVSKTRNFEEDVATELLIVRPDGKLVVRNSRVDEADENRKDVSSKWSEWLKMVETRKTAGAGGMGDDTNPFAPKKN